MTRINVKILHFIFKLFPSVAHNSVNYQRINKLSILRIFACLKRPSQGNIVLYKSH